MVRTRNQRASDETEVATPSVGTETVLPPGAIAGPSCSNLVKRSARKLSETATESASSTQLGTTKVGKPRQRIQWTHEMNVLNALRLRDYYTKS